MVRAFNSGKIFRLNYDLAKEYDVRISADGMKISSAFFSITEDKVSKAVWRKAFTGTNEFDKQIGAFESAEYKYLFREIFNLFERNGKTVFNRYDAEHRCGKLNQNRIASKYLKTPKFELFSINEKFTAGPETVIKSLSSVPFDDGNILYTKEVSGSTLAPRHLWYSQSLVNAESDVTVVYVYGRLFPFELNRDTFEGIDWRKDVFEVGPKWKPCELSSEEQDGILDFMREIGWTYGRLDFLRSQGELIFLEVNANGQWGWLDPHQTNGLATAIFDCIDPDTPIPNIGQL